MTMDSIKVKAESMVSVSFSIISINYMVVGILNIIPVVISVALQRSASNYHILD